MTDYPAIVRQAWTEALGHDRFSDEDHFFSIGGTSMSALTVMLKIKAEVGTKLPLRMIFDNQTVTGLAAAVERMPGVSER